MEQQQPEPRTKFLIFLNCFIPLDGKLQLCHLTIKDEYIDYIHVISNEIDYDSTCSSTDTTRNSTTSSSVRSFDQSSFGKVSSSSQTTCDSFLIPLIFHHQPDTQNHIHKNYQITTFECAGNILSPGFIDLQINGAFGIDFSSNPNNNHHNKNNNSLTQQDVLFVASQLTQYGVTHFCPTLVSSSTDTYHVLLHDIFGPLCRNDRNDPPKDRATLLGMHLEGPFFARSKRGAHGLEFIVDEIIGQEDHVFWTTYGLENMQDLCCSSGLGCGGCGGGGGCGDCGGSCKEIIKIVTLAPELPGVERYEIIQTLTKNGIVVSMGHTNATLQEGIQAVQNGARLITHLFNAMRPFHHREPGLLGLLSLMDDKTPPSLPRRRQQQEEQQQEEGMICNDGEELFYSIIADGLHCHPTSIQMAYKLSKNVILVTDGIAAMGLTDGEHSLGGEDVTVRLGKATIRGTDTLAGSVASMDSCIRSFWKFTGCSVSQVLKAVTENPARVLDLQEELGRIQVGRRADLVILDQELNVRRTIIAGSIVYEND